MAFFRRDNRSGGNRSFGSGGGFNRRGPREMHKAVCNNCGRECEVPFKPSGSKPVYCSDCFEKNDNRESRPDRFDRPNRNSNFENRSRPQQPSGDQFRELNIKLDKILNLLQPKNQPSAPPKSEIEIEDLIKIPEISEPQPAVEKPAKARKSKKAEPKITAEKPSRDA